MERLLKPNEREKLLDTFKTHPLLSICYKVYTPRMARLDKGFLVTPVDVFFESALLLDFLLGQLEISQHQVDSLWNLLYIDIMKWGTNVTDHNKRMIAGTVFQVVRATLTQYYKSYYCETICDLLNHTIERELKDCDEREQNEFLQRLRNQSSELCEWINNYDEVDEWLSDQITNTLERMSGTNAKKKGKGNASTDTKFEKQHGMEYPVFSKGSGVTDDHIKALYKLLTARGWISTQTKEVEFLRLFNGTDNDCEIIWTGKDKIGINEPTPLGVSALYVLFKRMADERLITTNNRGKAQRVGPVLESHIVDSQGHFLANVSNVSATSQVAVTYIDQMLKIMRLRPSSEDVQRLLQEDMESKYDEYDRQDLNYRKPH